MGDIVMSEHDNDDDFITGCSWAWPMAIVLWGVIIIVGLAFWHG